MKRNSWNDEDGLTNESTYVCRVKKLTIQQSLTPTINKLTTTNFINMGKAGGLAKGAPTFNKWLDNNHSNPKPSGDQMKKWQKEFKVTPLQLQTWFNKARSARKKKAKLAQSLIPTATNSNAVATASSATLSFEAKIADLKKVQHAVTTAEQEITTFQKNNPGDQKTDWNKNQRTTMAELHTKHKAVEEIENTCIVQSFVALQSQATDAKCKELCEMAIAAVHTLFNMNHSREATLVQSSEALPFESNDAFLCKHNVFKNADKSQLTYWKNQYYQAVLVKLVGNIMDIFKYLNMSSSDGASAYLLDIYTSDLAKKDAIVVQDKEKNKVHSKKVYDEKHYADGLTKKQLEDDADELMAGMFVMEYTKNNGMKMSALRG